MTRPAHGFSLIVVLALLLALSALASTGVAPVLLEQQVLQRERAQLQAEQAALAAMDAAQASLTATLAQQESSLDFPGSPRPPRYQWQLLQADATQQRYRLLAASYLPTQGGVLLQGEVRIALPASPTSTADTRLLRLQSLPWTALPQAWR